MGRDHTYAAELNNELVNNATVTVDRANALLKLFGTNRGVTSGWRPKTLNDATPGAAKKSNHIKCLAVDLEDKDGKLAKWCVENVGTSCRDWSLDGITDAHKGLGSRADNCAPVWESNIYSIEV